MGTQVIVELRAAGARAAAVELTPSVIGAARAFLAFWCIGALLHCEAQVRVGVSIVGQAR
ncbi:hypothetical protein RB628_29870 [Streptomyces sp. ADMS]|uniref:hypothetical protein n=1 Tax=Streptomyces sp. ADMS TaxID=3071415 RepID=UPI00296E3AEA|nr:hypothetical protein [Streptomyces sp. ADMS]MDW4909436.1 hypothetical protein [Streptomyces sp. ADMS]